MQLPLPLWHSFARRPLPSGATSAPSHAPPRFVRLGAISPLPAGFSTVGPVGSPEPLSGSPGSDRGLGVLSFTRRNSLCFLAFHRLPVCLPRIRSGNIDDEVHQES